jgi:hypothetical protein
VALDPPSTRFAVLIVSTSADEVAKAADTVDAAIDCAAAETASMVVFNRILFRKSGCIRGK